MDSVAVMVCTGTDFSGFWWYQWWSRGSVFGEAYFGEYFRGVIGRGGFGIVVALAYL